MMITIRGIARAYHGDVIIWLWPWKRNGNGKYYSLMFSRQFKTLQELDRAIAGFTEGL